ncbi:chorismate synthase [Candidatus Microgenomates bacterium]|nr:chorismate synthase [Candidatus Microgenomates bacterium]
MLRFLTAGESHGPAQMAILEGIPAGLALSVSDIQKELDKRKGGLGRGGRGKIETDEVDILSGVRLGKTMGSPIALMVKNKDFVNWQQTMSSVKLRHMESVLGSHVPVTNPRPGHADLAGVLKYGFDDVRNVSERASARETVMRAGIGAICKKFLKEFDISIASHTIQVGNIQMPMRPHDKKYMFEAVSKVDSIDPDIRCLDPKISQEMKKAILEAIKNKDTLGGVIEVIAHHVPVGLGSHVHWDRRLDGRLASALMSIPSVKAVEIGEGIASSGKYGSQVHDTLQGSTLQGRRTNRAGGIEGGISNGEEIVCKIYLKPIPTLGKPLDSVDIITKKPVKALTERSDVCVVPRAGVIAESMMAYVLAEVFLEKFGGDSMKETKRNYNGYLRSLR